MNFSEKYIFGTAKIHRLLTRRRIFELLDAAYNSGFRIFDTSPYYGLGFNERLLLYWVVSRNHSDVSINTKIGLAYPIWRSVSISDMLLQKAIVRLGLCSIKTTKKSLNIYFRNKKKPKYIFIHEPKLLGKKTSERLIHLKLENNLSINGYAGSLKHLELELNERLIRQVPFDEYPQGDVFYGIFSSQGKSFSFDLQGKFIYSTSKISRLIQFANGEL